MFLISKSSFAIYGITISVSEVVSCLYRVNNGFCGLLVNGITVSSL